MAKSGFDNRFYKKTGLAVLLLGISSGLFSGFAGCGFEQFVWRLEEEAGLWESGGERTLSLEEIERQAEQTVSANAQGQTVSEGGVGAGTWELPENGSFLFEGGSAYACGQLTESEQLWYRDMAQALGTMTDGVKLSEEGIQAGLDETVVDKIFQSVLNDHPELFYVEGYSYTSYTRGEKTVAIEFTGTYSQDFDTVLTRKREIERAVERVLAGAPDTEDEYEKIKYAYETLIRETDYDLDSEENQNIYSVFVGHSSVCQGYAKAFQYLMNRMGVECALVQGKVRETGEGHAWNLVSSNGDYYYVDTTWGDISYQSEQSGEQRLPQISYDYLCITTEQMERTHILGREAGMPECTAAADNYYVREGALFAEYDREQLAELVNRRLEQGDEAVALRCESEECYETMRDALLTRQEIFSYLEGTGIQSFAYTVDEQQLTLTFLW